MCYGCWEEMGSPSINSSATREAARLILEVYEYTMVGGNLHIAISDWNLDDDSISRCYGYILEAAVEGEDSKEQIEVEIECLAALRRLTEEGRASAMAIAEGYIEVGEVEKIG